MKLSNRLNTINTLITESYDVIWDCCCDHGFLGMAILKRNLADKIIFVDIVPALMADLSKTLTRFSCAQTAKQWQVKCQDVGSLELTPSAKQLVIIAGVGGELLLKLVQQIIINNTNHDLSKLSFILCPVHHTYSLRKGLHKLGLGLATEQIVLENKRFYEVLHVSFESEQPISSTGTIMWEENNTAHRMYLCQLIKHYTRMINKDPVYFQNVLNDYQQLVELKT
ncbi:tRNA (adenine(22)-N(1))-methyltransferase [Pseudoalteromonas sp. Ld20]|uniref:tRNA (adenine(22)-N(1))-methyltransferase n=1 Tax=Pseudoalteromonas sp. Ld20 TaxID=649165 RepID=UPI0038678EA9